ncbi:MAG TPA: tetratricopeptide repeat protein, partial [Isosphaeraceae bacterium]
ALLITAVVALAIGNYLIGREQARTERNYQLARAAVEQMLTEVGAVELADVPQMEAVRRRLLQRALAFYLTFLQERGNEAALRQDAAEAHTRLADIQEMLGAYDQAEPQYRQAIALLTALAAAAPEAAAPHRALAQADHGYGLLLRKANRFGEAEARLREALRLRERLVAAAPADPDDRQRLADTRYFLGALLARQARHAEDEALYQQALAEQERLVAENRDRPEYRGTLARYLNNVGILRSATGRPEAAEAAFREAEAIQQELTKSFPAMPGYRWQLARTASNLANLQIASGRAQPAEADFRRALALQEALAADYPKVPDYRSELAVISSNLGLLLTKLGRGPEAEDAFRRALGLQRALVAEFPRRPDDRQRLAVTDLNLAIVLEATAPAEARALYAEAIGAQEAIVGLYPTVPEYRGALGQSLWNLASFQFSRGAAAEALPILERGIGQLRTALEADGRNRSYRTALRAAQADLAVALIQKGDHAGAAAAAEEVPRLVPDEPDSSLRAAGYLARCGVIAGADARLPEPRRRELREDYARRAVAVLRQAVGLGVLANPRDLDRPELEPLRDRADMRAIRQDLDARATPRVG